MHAYCCRSQMSFLTACAITATRRYFPAQTSRALREEERMTSRRLQLDLASAFAFLLLVDVAGASLAASRTAVQGVGLLMAANTTPEPLDCTNGSATACFDIATDGANITHIFVDTGCALSPDDLAITV